MSDLISTPSQTRSPVSNEAFESLIDLLAFNGIDENSRKFPGDRPHAQDNVSLRDPSGKLDFDKIRLMFAEQHGSHRVSPSRDLFSEEKLEEERASGMARDDSDSEDDEDPSYQSTSSVAPSTRANSMSPKRAPAGHRRSSTFGNQPWTAIHENPTPVILVEDAPSTTLSHKPLSFDALNTALVGAHEEVKVLRQQYDDLRTIVSKRLGMETRDEAKLFPSIMDSEKAVPEKDNGGVDAGSQAQLTTAVPPAPVPSDVPTEIAGFSEIEAKRVLAALARSLNFSFDILVCLSNVPGPTSPQTLLPSSLHDIAPISRAVKFLSTIDELVWRRSSAPSGPRTLSPVSSEENITALVARLELWERTIRRSGRT